MGATLGRHGPREKVGFEGQLGHDARVTRSVPPRTTPRGLAVACAALGASLVLASSPAAFAQAPHAPSATDLVAARALFAAGVADEKAGRWDDALLKIRRASAVKLTPGLRFHIALCEERLGHLVAASVGYEAAAAAARAEHNAEVLALVDSPLRDLKVRMPTVTVNLPRRFARSGSGAEVRMDGVSLPLPSLGTSVPVDVGSHTIQATAPGETPYAMTLTVVERQAATLDIQFLPLGGVIPVAVGPSSATRSATGSGNPPVGKAEATSAASGAAPHSNTLAIVATAGAVGLVAVGVGAFVLAGSDQSYWDGICQGRQAPCGNATPVRAWDAAALTGWIAGAGVGVAAIVLWAKPGDSGHAELHAGPGTLSLTGTF
jgi:hypothetical protein